MARRGKAKPSNLEIGLANQNVALGIFQEVLSSLEDSDSYLTDHQAANDAEIARCQANIAQLQDEHNTVATNLERNARVRAKVEEILGA